MQIETTLVGNYFLPIVLNFQDVLEKLSDDEFENLCRRNPDLQIELTREGELVIIPPTGGEKGILNFSLIFEFGKWLEKSQSGIAFDSSTLFVLPNGARHSPDLAWVKKEKWDALSEQEKKKFPPFCPDFVVELRSPSDLLSNLRAKMEEYIENGASLGWLIDPLERKVYVYRPNAGMEILDNPETVSGEPELEKFVLKTEKIWS